MAFQVSQVKMALMVYPDKEALLVLLATMVKTEAQGHKDNRDLRVPPEHRDLGVDLEKKGRLVRQGLKDSLVLRVKMASTDHQALPVHPVSTAAVVRRVQWELPGSQDPKVKQEHQDPAAFRDPKASWSQHPSYTLYLTIPYL